MIPGVLNLSLYRGDSVDLVVRLREKNLDGTPGPYVNLSGVTVRSQIRQTEDSTNILATFVSTVMDQAVTPGGVRLTLASAATSLLPVLTPLRWDLEITHTGGHVRTYLRGNVSVQADVTR